MQKLSVETRFIVADKSKFISKLVENDYKLTKTQYITDTYYCDPKNLNPNLHTFEVTGKTFRLRVISEKSLNDADSKILIQLKEAGKKTKEGKPSHELVKTTTLFEGTKKDVNKVDDYAKEHGMTSVVLELQKTREIYEKDETLINVDLISGSVTVCEILNTVKSAKEYLKVKKQQENLCKLLGVSESSLFTDSYNHRAITAKIKSDPKLRTKALEDELKALTQRLREIEKEAGEAYQDDFGNGWHDNTRYSALYEQIKIYNHQIIETKTELLTIKREN